MERTWYTKTHIENSEELYKITTLLKKQTKTSSIYVPTKAGSTSFYENVKLLRGFWERIRPAPLYLHRADKFKIRVCALLYLHGADGFKIRVCALLYLHGADGFRICVCALLIVQARPYCWTHNTLAKNSKEESQGKRQTPLVSDKLYRPKAQSGEDNLRGSQLTLDLDV